MLEGLILLVANQFAANSKFGELQTASIDFFVALGVSGTS